MTNRFIKILEPFYGKRCTIEADIDYCGESFQPDIFDAKKAEDFVESYIDGVIGSWEDVEDGFGTEPGELIMFAANFLDEFADAVLFYHIKTGMVYKYEEADFSATELKLDKLGLQAIGQTPPGLIT
jgi:hypothetical protein